MSPEPLHQSENSYAFGHDLVREAAYSLLSIDERRNLHQQACLLMGNSRHRAIEVARHAALAGASDSEVWQAAVSAAEHLGDESNRCWALSMLARETTAAPQVRLDAAYALARTMAAVDNFAEFKRWSAVTARLAKACNNVRLRFSVLVKFAGGLQSHGMAAAALRKLRRAAQFLQDESAREFVPGYYLNLGNSLAAQQQMDAAVEAYRKAASLARQTGNLRLAVGAQVNVGNHLSFSGDFVGAIALYESALELCGLINVREIECKVEGNLGFALRRVGRLTEAKRHFERALQLATSAGLLHSVAETWNNLATIAVDRGDLKTAFECHVNAVRYHRACGTKGGALAVSLANLASDLSERNEFTEAASLFDEAFAQVVSFCEPQDEVVVRLSYTRHLLKQHRLSEALSSCREACDVAGRAGIVLFRAYTLTLRAEIEIQDGQYSNALASCMEAQPAYAEASMEKTVHYLEYLIILITAMSRVGDVAGAEFVAKDLRELAQDLESREQHSPLIAIAYKTLESLIAARVSAPRSHL
jgi:tetratricopeptide (TPR) repeat protein